MHPTLPAGVDLAAAALTLLLPSASPEDEPPSQVGAATPLAAESAWLGPVSGPGKALPAASGVRCPRVVKHLPQNSSSRQRQECRRR